MVHTFELVCERRDFLLDLLHFLALGLHLVGQPIQGLLPLCVRGIARIAVKLLPMEIEVSLEQVQLVLRRLQVLLLLCQLRLCLRPIFFLLFVCGLGALAGGGRGTGRLGLPGSGLPGLGGPADDIHGGTGQLRKVVVGPHSLGLRCRLLLLAQPTR